MDERKQFTFYGSFYAAIKRIKKDADRAKIYDAICAYALTGELPDVESLSEAAAMAFELIKPTLDTSRRKSENGRRGGGSAASNEEANDKQTASKPEANMKQTASKREANPKQNGASAKQTASEKEGEIEKEIEIEIEKESYISPYSPPLEKKPTKHKYGQYENVLLSDTDMEKLKAEFPDYEQRIERLSEYIKYKGAKYKDHLATIRAWARKDREESYGADREHKPAKSKWNIKPTVDAC